MKIHLLGGANEVGASAVLVEAGGCRVLVDAGIRMGEGQKDRLPDLSRITDLGGLDAVIATHAHLDHTGALPLVHGAFPGAAVFMTEPTRALLRILLLDALHIMEMKSEREGEIPLYPLPAVESLLAQARAVRFHEPIDLANGGIRATFFPAGHVLGAAAVGLETPEGNVLISGDVSLTDQRTVSGMPAPRFSPDILVLESTYGGRLHASRKAEEERLSATVLDAVRQGQKVLIPAFALGRAQEVLLILRRAVASEGAPPTTVHADGMVRAVCGTYRQFPEYLSPVLRKRVEDGKDLFFTADGRVRPVGAPTEREAILAGPPCVIVSSSGMLSGGPSGFYAARLAGNENALIAITGYQDEEAPGRRLMEVARGERPDVVIDGVVVPVRCRVESYSLSAHADSQELCGLVGLLKPEAVILVHGDRDARTSLAAALAGVIPGELHLPSAGDCIEHTRKSGWSDRPVKGIGAGRPLDGAALIEIHQALRARPRSGYTAHDIARFWHGTADAPPDLTAIRDALTAATALFSADPKRPFHFRPLLQGAGAPAAEPPDAHGAVPSGVMEQNAALATADRLLPPETGLYRRGAERDRGVLRLFFRFPDVARAAHAAAIAALAEQTGWSIEVHPEVHLLSLEQAAREILGGEFPPTRPVSYHREERVVKVLTACMPDEVCRESLTGRFFETTGFRLVFQAPTPATPVPASLYDATGRMEINLAFVEITKRFEGLPHMPQKKSRKTDQDGELLELAFISPDVGARYSEIIADLQRETCWRIRVADKVNQQAILQSVAELVPREWRASRPPGLDVAHRKIKLHVDPPPPASELQALGRELRLRTGFDLE